MQSWQTKPKLYTARYLYATYKKQFFSIHERKLVHLHIIIKKKKVKLTCRIPLVSGEMMMSVRGEAGESEPVHAASRPTTVTALVLSLLTAPRLTSTPPTPPPDGTWKHTHKISLTQLQVQE